MDSLRLMNWHNFPFVNVSVNQAFAEFTKQALVGVIYFVTLCFSSWVSNHLETVAQSSAIFLPAGVKLAFFIIFPIRFWPILWFSSRLYAAYIGMFYNDAWHFDLLHGFWQEATYMIIVHCFKESRWPPKIDANTGVISIVLLATSTAAIKWFLFASAFEFTTWLAGKQLLQYQLNMTLGDLTGTLLVAPILLSIKESYKHKITLNNYLLVIALLALTIVYLAAYIHRPDLYSLLRLFSLLPILWFSYKFATTGAILSALLSNSLIVVQAGIQQDATNTYISQLFILANSITGLLIGTATNELKLKNAELQQSNEQLSQLLAKNKQLAKRMVTIQEDERKYLSQELHDELGQNLTALKTDLAVLSLSQQNSNNSIIATLRENAKAMYDSVYQIMHHLRPRELDELGLEHALKNGKLKSLLNKADIEYQTNLDINSTLADEHQTAIYRICQEAVTNCIKHSSASQLLVQLSVNKQAIDLIIKDNGEQVRNNAESGGYGLLFIEERVLALGGKCSFDTQGGFTIKVSF